MIAAATVDMIQARARDLQGQYEFSNEEAFYLAAMEHDFTPLYDTSQPRVKCPCDSCMSTADRGVDHDVLANSNRAPHT